MKIHGTTKGGALSKKDFGVAFGGGAAGFDDTALKAYWKCDAASSPLLNASESDVDLGSAANVAVTNGSFQTGSPPLSNGVLFNGTSAYGVAGTSVSQWDYFHDTSALFTLAFWFKLAGITENDFFFANTDGSDAQGFRFRMSENDPAAAFQLEIKSDSAAIVNATTTITFIPDSTNWYFYTITYSQALSSDNLVFRRDNSNEETFNKTGNTPVDENAENSAQFARKTGASENFGNFYLSECSNWNKVMSDQDQASLYNDGDGLEIY